MSKLVGILNLWTTTSAGIDEALHSLAETWKEGHNDYTQDSADDRSMLAGLTAVSKPRLITETAPLLKIQGASK